MNYPLDLIDKFNTLKEKYPIIYYFNQSRIHYLIMLNILNITKNEKYGYEFFYKTLTPEYCSRNTIKKIISEAIFKNYLYFVMNFCIENESNNCRKTVLEFLKEHGLGKNLHKKNIVKYIKWKN